MEKRKYVQVTTNEFEDGASEVELCEERLHDSNFLEEEKLEIMQELEIMNTLAGKEAKRLATRNFNLLVCTLCLFFAFIGSYVVMKNHFEDATKQEFAELETELSLDEETLETQESSVQQRLQTFEMLLQNLTNREGQYLQVLETLRTKLDEQDPETLALDVESLRKRVEEQNQLIHELESRPQIDVKQPDIQSLANKLQSAYDQRMEKIEERQQDTNAVNTNIQTRIGSLTTKVIEAQRSITKTESLIAAVSSGSSTPETPVSPENQAPRIESDLSGDDSSIIYAPVSQDRLPWEKSQDCELNKLTEIMNNLDLPQGLRNLDDVSTFLNGLTEYLRLPPQVPVKTWKPPPLGELDCGNPTFSTIFTGKVDPDPKYIIDVVPFGFDLDFLEIRLAEYHDLVDLYIVNEFNLTAKGRLKPFLFGLVREQPRFKRWENRIMYRFKGVDHLREKAIQGGWDIEQQARYFPVQELKKSVDEDGNPYKVPLSFKGAWVVQNDGDEMVHRRTMQHFKFCELKSQQQQLYAPAYSFKKDVNYIQHTVDVTMVSFPGQDSLLEFRNWLWLAGPIIHPLTKVWNVGHTNRYDEDKWHHFGLGAASHFSSFQEPTKSLLKHYAIRDQGDHGYSKEFVAALQDHTMTADLIRQETNVHLATGGRNFYKHTTDIFTEEQRRFIYDTLPWLLKDNPERYCWDIGDLDNGLLKPGDPPDTSD